MKRKSVCTYCTCILMFLCTYVYGDENKDIAIDYELGL